MHIGVINMDMKKGDVFVGPSVADLLKVEVCHKSEGPKHYYRCGIVCGPRDTVLSHNDWDKVTCPKCLSLKRVN